MLFLCIFNANFMTFYALFNAILCLISLFNAIFMILRCQLARMMKDLSQGQSPWKCSSFFNPWKAWKWHFQHQIMWHEWHEMILSPPQNQRCRNKMWQEYKYSRVNARYLLFFTCATHGNLVIQSVWKVFFSHNIDDFMSRDHSIIT